MLVRAGDHEARQQGDKHGAPRIKISQLLVGSDNMVVSKLGGQWKRRLSAPDKYGQSLNTLDLNAFAL